MEPTYLHQTFLPVPFPALQRTCWTQPFTDASIVRWLIANRNDSLQDVFIPGYLALTDVPSDQVLCYVFLSANEMIDEIYSDKVTLYSLFLAVDIPKSSGIDNLYLESPLAALATFQANLSNDEPPKWTRLKPGCPLLFRQPRGAMAEVFWALAFWQDNQVTKRLSVEMKAWAIAIAAGTPAETKHHLMRPFTRPFTPDQPTQPPPQNAPRRPSHRETESKQNYQVDTSPCLHRAGRASRGGL